LLSVSLCFLHFRSLLSLSFSLCLFRVVAISLSL
jgi:hypothetical protein